MKTKFTPLNRILALVLAFSFVMPIIPFRYMDGILRNGSGKV